MEALMVMLPSIKKVKIIVDLFELMLYHNGKKGKKVVNARKLKTLIEENKPLITSGKVCYCYFHTEKCKQVTIANLEQEELETRYKNSEWWIEDGDLCLMKGRNW